MVELNLNIILKKIKRFKKLICHAYLNRHEQKLNSLQRILKASRSFKFWINQKSPNQVIQMWLIQAEFSHLLNRLKSASFDVLNSKINHQKFYKLSKYYKLFKIKRWAKRKHANKSWTWIQQKYQFNQLFKAKNIYREAV